MNYPKKIKNYKTVTAFFMRVSPPTPTSKCVHIGEGKNTNIFKTLVNEDRRPINVNFICHYNEYVLSSCLSKYLTLIAAFLYNY